MNPFLMVAVNMASCPGVKNTGLEHRPDGAVCLTVTGGNPKTVAAMILQCLPPGTVTAGDTVVEIEGTVVRLNHVNPTPELPEDFVAPLPLVTPEGRTEPMGATLAPTEKAVEPKKNTSSVLTIEVGKEKRIVFKKTITTTQVVVAGVLVLIVFLAIQLLLG